MEFFSSAVDTLQTLVVALGAGLGVWGVVNLLEGYGSDNPGSKSQGMKQLMAGGGIILLGTTLIPLHKKIIAKKTRSQPILSPRCPGLRRPIPAIPSPGQ